MAMRLGSSLRGPGHASCKSISVPTQDGPSRYFKFRLKPIRKDYWNVLCFADAKTLRRTANEILNDCKNNATPLKLLSATDDKNSRDFKTSCNVSKSKGFWTVFSKRSKASMALLSVPDTVAILKAFDVCNKDTGIYVSAVCALQNRIAEFDSESLVAALAIFSKRLRLHSQIKFFESLAKHVPNVVYTMSAMDIIATLWYLSKAGYRHENVCKYVKDKFLTYCDDLNHTDLANACVAFASLGYRDEHLYNSLESNIPLDVNDSVLYAFAWGLKTSGMGVDDFIKNRQDVLKSKLKRASGAEIEAWRNVLRGSNFTFLVDEFGMNSSIL